MPKIYYRGERFTGHSPSLDERPEVVFRPHRKNRPVTVQTVIEHIISGTEETPFVSVTLSKSIAERYATEDGVVWALQLSAALQIINPVSVINTWLVFRRRNDRSFKRLSVSSGWCNLG